MLFTTRTTLGLALATLGAIRAQAQEPQRAQAPTVEYRQLAPGVLASATPLFTSDSLPGYTLEVIDLVLGPNQNAERVPLEGFALLELRAGVAQVTINGTATRREAGAHWFVPRGAQFAIRNLAEVTMIRATVFRPR